MKGKTSAATLGLVGGLALGVWIGAEMLPARDMMMRTRSRISSRALRSSVMSWRAVASVVGATLLIQSSAVDDTASECRGRRDSSSTTPRFMGERSVSLKRWEEVYPISN